MRSQRPDREAQIYENLEYDIYYVRNRCLLLDMLILLETLVFTASLPFFRLAELVKKNAPGAATVGAAGLSSGEVETSSSGSYLLLALDQRRRNGEGHHWAHFVVAARNAAGGRPVRILVAPSNVPEMKRVLQQRVGGNVLNLAGDGDNGTPDRPVSTGAQATSSERVDLPIELVPYRGPGDVSAFVTSASVVITDLLHVREEVSRDSGKKLVYVDEAGSVNWEGANGDSGDPIMERLVEALSGSGIPRGADPTDTAH